ncbi:MAG: acyl-CoA dehydrogenase family protein [Thermodesulfobacteriota bacterium]|nr:acyl-CoA dehydrogenase family protein [Thermodesulfobacteriota bacterium]
MINFETPEMVKQIKDLLHGMAKDVMRPIARYYDEHEHEMAKELDAFAPIMQAGMGGSRKKGKKEKKEIKETEDRVGANAISVAAAEELAWGDVGLMLAMPGAGLGNAAIDAVATDEQYERFGKKYAAMAITEPGCGSDASAVTATAVLDGDEYVLNGEKIFVTDGDRCEAAVIWATLDKTKGRAAIKSFVVEKGTPGFSVEKLEKKCGIRASDTATLVLDDCRIPKENLLGDPEIKPKGGFKGVMKTFDNTRPLVAAMALGCAEAAFEFTKEAMEKEGVEVRYDRGIHKQSAIEKDLIWMDANLEVMRLLTERAAWMADNARANNLEASISKAKAGKYGNLIVQKCVELLGPIGYSQKYLIEKWMRDNKVNDIYEGTQQIQMLVIARRILGYGRDMLS